MIRRLLLILRRPALVSARQRAAERLADARRRGDTRDQHTAAAALQHATTAQLRAEVGR